MRRISINGINTDYLPIMDRGLHYGDGLFETIACRDGMMQLWREHIQRMEAGADALGINFPGEDRYMDDIETLIDPVRNKNCVIKLLLTRGSGERGYRQPRNARPLRAVIISDLPDHSPELVERGIKVCLCKHPASANPVLAGIKHLNRLDNVLARSEWQDEYDEGFMLDAQGNLIEGTMSNVFFVKDGELFTPAVDQCGVKGVVREQVLLIAEKNNFKMHVKKTGVDELHMADEIFITNSVIGIWPVNHFDETSYPVGDITRRFQEALLQRINDNAKSFA
jgi:4-amino-4-deoxychorismate lyase